MDSWDWAGGGGRGEGGGGGVEGGEGGEGSTTMFNSFAKMWTMTIVSSII